ncbi:MAG: alkaline phosphatase family protein [Candidatus Omnitrophica bacterium]|nr:alkaline phosphatase family protein [Candidatus Omnitrophota bacterium]
MRRPSRVLVIGLDCLTPQLVFDQWRGELPHLSRLMARGLWGRLKTTVPPITVPAWMSMMTGRDPGELGFYGFRNRADHSYHKLAYATSALVQEPTVWDLLSRAGKHVVILGVPQTYPPKPVNGCLVSCFLTPDTNAQYTYPAELKEEIRAVVGDYVLDVHDFRTDDKQRILDQIYDMTAKRFRLARHLMQTKPWDFFMVHEIGIDRIHHGFWKYMDATHPKHEPGNPYQDAILRYYQFVDQQVGELIALSGDETAVLIVSDHGAKRMLGGICFNDWLIRQGYLRLKTMPSQPTPLEKLEVDWTKTRVWGAGGYYGRVFLNVKGREPQGLIEPSESEAFRDRLIREIEAIPDHAGRRLATHVYKPEQIYRACRGVAPDLIIYFDDLEWRSVGSVGYDSLYTFDNDTGPDDANHAQHGICVMRDSDRQGCRENLTIYDIAPTILDLFGLPIPAAMQGRVIA